MIVFKENRHFFNLENRYLEQKLSFVKPNLLFKVPTVIAIVSICPRNTPTWTIQKWFHRMRKAQTVHNVQNDNVIFKCQESHWGSNVVAFFNIQSVPHPEMNLFSILCHLTPIQHLHFVSFLCLFHSCIWHEGNVKLTNSFQPNTNKARQLVFIQTNLYC